MLPLTDENNESPTNQPPLVNWAIILLNILLFLFELFEDQSGQLDNFLNVYGLVPIKLVSDPGWQTYFSVLSSMFLHGGFGHIFGNLWYLQIFGDNIEDEIGHFPYLIFYLLCGLAAAMAQVMMAPSSKVPLIGASGAIAGVLGAYLILFPNNRIQTMITPFRLSLYYSRTELPALIVIGFWFVYQFFAGFWSILSPQMTEGEGIAWWAHVGGFITGAVLIKFFQLAFPKDRNNNSKYDYYS
jgi:membrane associated rhomboid family serine protease